MQEGARWRAAIAKGNVEHWWGDRNTGTVAVNFWEGDKHEI